MTTQTYTTATNFHSTPTVVRTSPAATARPSRQLRRASTADVCDLIDAAGPLSLCDIAGGLDIHVAQASRVVRTMVADACLREDEWGRFGICRSS